MPPVLTGLSDEKAARMLDGFRSGSTLRPFHEKVARFKAYCVAHPEYAREAESLLAKNMKLAHARKGSRLRDATHCKYGHPLTPDNVYFFPYRNRLGRKCKLCTKRNSEAPPPATEDQIARVTAALNAGQRINQICAGMVDGKRVTNRILGFNKLRVYRAQNPDFDRFVCSMTSAGRTRAQQIRQCPGSAQANVARAQANDYHAIAALVPHNLPSDVRDDIVQSIFMALLEGSLRRDQVKDRIRQFVADHNRMFPTKFRKFGDSQLVSLDEVLFDDGTATRGDMVSRGLWD
jgi:hypothetical protein